MARAKRGFGFGGRKLSAAKTTPGLHWYGHKVSTAFQNGMFVGIDGAARYLRDYIKRSFSTPKTGKWYVKPISGKQPKPGKGKGKRQYYQASKAGETPAVPTGDLRGSIRKKVFKGVPGPYNITAWIGIFGDATATAPYGRTLELGRGRLKGPHPFLRPALVINLAVLKKIIVQGMKGRQIATMAGTLGGFEESKTTYVKVKAP